jgi:hypothetical protein
MPKGSPATRQWALAAQRAVDPHHLAELLAHERAALYADLGLDLLQRAAAEDAVRAMISRRYRKAG